MDCMRLASNTHTCSQSGTPVAVFRPLPPFQARLACKRLGTAPGSNGVTHNRVDIDRGGIGERHGHAIGRAGVGKLLLPPGVP
jgi:hypothetical protein